MKIRGNRKSITGTVVSNKMEKTVVVAVERLVRHPVYQKYIQRQQKYLAHDEQISAESGTGCCFTKPGL